MTGQRHHSLLLDLDGVILDSEGWNDECDRLAGDAFASLLGGKPAAWAEHQHRVWLEVWENGCREYSDEQGLRRLNLYRWWDRLNDQWIRGLCRTLDVQPPATFEARVDVVERALTFIYEHTRAVVPGAADAIKSLSRDFELHMASGNPAWIIETVLTRLGVRDLIGKPFGSDLIGYQKGHPRFYPAIVEAVQATPANCIVVDDGEGVLGNAAVAGLKTVKVGGSDTGRFDLTIGSIAELPNAILSLGLA